MSRTMSLHLHHITGLSFFDVNVMCTVDFNVVYCYLGRRGTINFTVMVRNKAQIHPLNDRVKCCTV